MTAISGCPHPGFHRPQALQDLPGADLPRFLFRAQKPVVRGKVLAAAPAHEMRKGLRRVPRTQARQGQRAVVATVHHLPAGTRTILPQELGELAKGRSPTGIITDRCLRRFIIPVEEEHAHDVPYPGGDHQPIFRYRPVEFGHHGIVEVLESAEPRVLPEKYRFLPLKRVRQVRLDPAEVTVQYRSVGCQLFTPACFIRIPVLDESCLDIRKPHAVFAQARQEKVLRDYLEIRLSEVLHQIVKWHRYP